MMVLKQREKRLLASHPFAFFALKTGRWSGMRMKHEMKLHALILPVAFAAACPIISRSECNPNRFAV